MISATMASCPRAAASGSALAAAVYDSIFEKRNSSKTRSFDVPFAI